MSIDKEMEHRGKTVAISKEGFKIIDCEICGFLHQQYLPKSIERDYFYKEQYFQDKKVNYYEREKEDKEYNNLRFSDKEKILRKNIDSLSLSILDIGAGSGFFLDFLRIKGWYIKAVEPNKLIYELVKKELSIECFCGTLNDFLKNSNEKFSVIHLAFVLEHITKPISLLEKIYNILLSENGVICVEVPNDFNILQKVID